MADDLDIENYKIQLQQVEAALIAEPENEELLKLKHDLQEVIDLSVDLVGNAAAVQAPETSSSTEKPIRSWKVGDKCMAVWAKNGQYHEAVIDGISDGKAFLTFVGWKTTDINRLGQLKVAEPSVKKTYVFESKAGKHKEWQMEKEKRKQKALKKAVRQKTLEEEKEKDKKRWKDFTHKATHKNFKGIKKNTHSIFSSPDSLSGKVGVGTCGTSGQPMTQQRLLSGAYKRPNQFTERP